MFPNRWKMVVLRSWRLLVATCILFALFFIFDFNREPDIVQFAKKCYSHNGKVVNGTSQPIAYFDDLFASVKQPTLDKGIFFIEGHCSHTGIAELKPRYGILCHPPFHWYIISSSLMYFAIYRFACSIESAATSNPDREIFLIFPSPAGLPLEEREWPSTIRALLEYPNIFIRNVQFAQLCQGTPLDDWLDSSEFFKSFVPDVHISDIIRLLLLYKYGGTYADLDYMILKRLDRYERNWVPFQNEDDLANAFYDSLHNGVGHRMLHISLKWAYFRVYYIRCHVKQILKFQNWISESKNFQISQAGIRLCIVGGQRNSHYWTCFGHTLWFIQIQTCQSYTVSGNWSIFIGTILSPVWIRLSQIL